MKPRPMFDRQTSPHLQAACAAYPRSLQRQAAKMLLEYKHDLERILSDATRTSPDDHSDAQGGTHDA